MTKKESFHSKLRLIMLRAWGLFRRGVLSMSLSLKMSWNVAKGRITEGNLIKQLFKKGHTKQTVTTNGELFN